MRLRLKCLGLLVPVFVLLSLSLTRAEPADAVRFALGSLDRLQVGQSYVYSLRLLMNGPSGYSTDWVVPPNQPARYEMRHFRIVVTDVLQADAATRVMARLDKLNEKGELLYKGVYTLILASEGRKTKCVVNSSFNEGPAMHDFTWQEIPPMFIELPPTTSVEPRGTASAFAVLAGHIPTRYTTHYDATKEHVVASVDTFTPAYEEDPAKGREVLYWVRDQNKVQATVPMGQEAGPLLKPMGPTPKDQFGNPRIYNVTPVRLKETDTMVWQPGAAFPAKITRTTAAGQVRFEAALTKLEQMPVEQATPQAEPAAGAPSN